MKTLSNMLLMLSLSAPLFANNITPPPPPPPPPEKLAENTSTQDFPGISQTFNSTVTNPNNTPLIAAEAANNSTPQSKEEPEMLSPLTVQGTPIEEITVTGQAETYAGGQVTRSGRIGLLGNQDIFDTPFSVTSYTSELIENQQAKTVADVVRNDSSVHLSYPSQGFGQAFGIRGFTTNVNAELYDGLSSMTFSDTLAVRFLERVEVFKGPNALLNGTIGNVGGVINLVPKRPTENSLTRLTTDYDYRSRFGVHTDLSRRFGSKKQFGARLNAVYHKGEAAIEDNKEELGQVALALEYRGDRLKLETILDYSNRHLDRGNQLFILNSKTTSAPSVPDLEDAIQQPWERHEPEFGRALFRAEYNLDKDWTMHAAYGVFDLSTYNLRTIGLNLNNKGDFNTLGQQILVNRERYTWNAGIKGQFETGGITHQISVETMRSKQKIASFFMIVPSASFASNLYNPRFFAQPEFEPEFDRITRKPPKSSSRVYSSTAIADTLGFFDQRVLLTAGIRRQSIDARIFNPNTGILTSQYDKSANTPAVGLLVKPWDFMSLYGNYIEALEGGPTAPIGTVNEGEVFPPSVTDQIELGVKFDLDGLGLTAGLFQIEKPNGITDANNRFGLNGEQRNRGLELNAFGELRPNLRLLGGITYIDSKLTRTQGGRFDGKNTPGVPELAAVLNLEYDTPAFPGLTLMARAEHMSSRFIRNDNSLKVPSYQLYGIGARYKRMIGDKEFTLRMNINNLLDEDYWIPYAGAGNFLYLGAPRNINLSFMVDF